MRKKAKKNDERMTGPFVVIVEDGPKLQHRTMSSA